MTGELGGEPFDADAELQQLLAQQQTEAETPDDGDEPQSDLALGPIELI